MKAFFRAGLPAALAALVMLAAAPAFGQAAEGGTPAPLYGLDVIRAFGMFVLVLALLFLTLKLIGRFGRFRGGRGKNSVFAMRGLMPLDNRKYLAAVEVAGRLLVLGVTQDRIVPLADWPEKRPGETPGDFALNFHEDEDAPPDISIAGTREGGLK